MSVVETNQKQLEALGDYVTRANVDWFAVVSRPVFVLRTSVFAYRLPSPPAASS